MAKPYAQDLRERRVRADRVGDRRYKRLIGDVLRSREDARRVCEVKIAVKVLNRMMELGRPVCVRVA